VGKIGEDKEDLIVLSGGRRYRKVLLAMKEENRKLSQAYTKQEKNKGIETPHQKENPGKETIYHEERCLQGG